jgi:hypothetical protein
MLHINSHRETTVTTAALNNATPYPAQAAGCTAAALRSLMQIWEEEVSLEEIEEESETELMVLLSRMVSPEATALGND